MAKLGIRYIKSYIIPVRGFSLCLTVLKQQADLIVRVKCQGIVTETEKVATEVVFHFRQ